MQCKSRWFFFIWIYVMKSSHTHSIIYVYYCLKACIRSLQTYEACLCMRWNLFSRLKLYDKFSTAHWNGLKFSFHIWGKLPRWYCHRCRRVFIAFCFPDVIRSTFYPFLLVEFRCNNFNNNKIESQKYIQLLEKVRRGTQV